MKSQQVCSKVFDTLDHEILFAKSEHYGIRDVALRWIKSYFSCRQQFVQFNVACSTKQTIKCGVPQGSILGPLFFILYINDLPNASKLTQPLLFADDTSIFCSHSDSNRLQSVLNEELSNFDVWLKFNKLSVNRKKNNYIFFKSRQKELNYHFTLFFGNQPLVQANMTKFLSVYVDEHLTWKHHISFICKQISKSVGSAIYPPELQLTDTSTSSTEVCYLDTHIKTGGTNTPFRISIYDKRDDFAFRIVNFPHMDSNIPANPAYGVYISQLVRYARICTSKVDFMNRLRGLPSRLRQQGFLTKLLQRTFTKFFNRHGLIVVKYGTTLREMRFAIQA